METKEEILNKYLKMILSKETGSFELRQWILKAMEEFGEVRYAEGWKDGYKINQL